MRISTLPLAADYRQSLNQHVLRAIPQGSRCLDVGCWNGNLGKFLVAEKGCRVDGIDVLPNILEEARKNGYEQVYQMNLNGEVLDSSILNGEKYDIIIFADVLEHLISPVGVLRFFSQFLTPNGRIVLSLPNVAFFMNRWRLLLGDWKYQDFGTLDRTHLRFYTLSSSKELIQDAGLDVSFFRPYNQFGVLRYFDPPIFPSLLAYQILLIAELPKK